MLGVVGTLCASIYPTCRKSFALALFRLANFTCMLVSCVVLALFLTSTIDLVTVGISISFTN